VLKLLEQLTERGITLVIVTHDAEIGARAQRQIHMLDGRILSDEQRAS
jgi:putative ABC transport system ATP-binding protein